MNKVIKESQFYLTHNVTYEDRILSIASLGEMMLMIFENGKMQVFNEGWKLIKSYDILPNKRYFHQDELNLVHSSDGLHIIKINISTLAIESTTINLQQPILQIVLLAQIESLIYDGMGISIQNELMVFLAYRDNLHIEPYSPLANCQVRHLFRLKQWICGCTSDSDVFFINRDHGVLSYLEGDTRTELYQATQSKDTILLLFKESLQFYRSDDNQLFPIRRIDIQDTVKVLIDSFRILQIHNSEIFISSSEQDKFEQITRISNNDNILSESINHMSSNQQFIVLYGTNKLILLYKINYKALLNAIFAQQQIIRLRQLPITPSRVSNGIALQFTTSDSVLFQTLKLNRSLDIDNLIQLSLKLGYFQSLLLLCSRIRNYSIFFKHWVESKNSINLTIPILQICECFDKQYIKEELIRSIVLLHKENPHYEKLRDCVQLIVNNSKYVQRMEQFIACFDLCNQKPNKLEIKSRVLNEIEFIKTAKKISFQDNYLKKLALVLSHQRGYHLRNPMYCWGCQQHFRISESKDNDEDSIIFFVQCHHMYHLSCLIKLKQPGQQMSSNNLQCPSCMRQMRNVYQEMFLLREQKMRALLGLT